MLSPAIAVSQTAASSLSGILGACLAATVVALVALLVFRRRDRGRIRQLEQSEVRLRLIFDRSPDATTLFDTREGRFTHCNEAALRLLRSGREYIVGRHPWELSPPLQGDGVPSQEKAAQLIAAVNQSGAAKFEWLHRRADGTDFPAEISITLLENSDQPLWMAVIRDITEWKRAQAEAELANQSLEKRVTERTTELARANEQLHLTEDELRRALAAERELNELKSNFVAMVSHEFRTPLGIISSSAQILDRYFARLAESERREHLGAINDAVRRMAAMMENVLLLSRMDRSRMEFAPAELDLEAFCRRLIDELHSSTSAPQPIAITFAPDVPAAILADENLLRHILTNLLSNAVKYSPPDQSARLSVTRNGGGLAFAVSDRGIGIPPEDREHLFQTFHRGSNVGQRPGTGLGLVIVKRCCDLHGAAIAFTSQPGGGTVFTVHLPDSHTRPFLTSHDQDSRN
jgi:PAS domain S-box-containing protein